MRAENQFNEPPAKGNRFYLITVEVASVSGSGSITVSESDFKLIGDNRAVYRPSCGVIPDGLGGEIFVGGRTAGNICFQIPEGEDGLVLIHQAFYSFRAGRPPLPESRLAGAWLAICSYCSTYCHSRPRNTGFATGNGTGQSGGGGRIALGGARNGNSGHRHHGECLGSGAGGEPV